MSVETKQRIITCILCPNGCEITAECANGSVVSVSGNTCPRGADYARQEIINPMRNLASSVLVEGGELPLASVRLSRPIPKGRIMDVMGEIRKVRISAPVRMGQTIIGDVLGLGSDVIATRDVERSEGDV